MSMYLRTATLVLLLIISSGVFAREPAAEPYYGFYPSPIGADWKKLKHNLLGFSIDVPASWTFGVSGTGALVVALLYPETIDTSKFHENYQSIEIGRIGGSMTLEQVKRSVVAGMLQKHMDAEVIAPIVGQPKDKELKDNVVIAWTSKTNIRVVEDITLVRTPDSIRSVTVRSSESVARTNKAVHRRIVESFVAHQSKP